MYVCIYMRATTVYTCIIFIYSIYIYICTYIFSGERKKRSILFVKEKYVQKIKMQEQCVIELHYGFVNSV